MCVTIPAVDIPAELQQRIADVRDNSTPTDWVLASLSAESEGAAALRVVGSGSGGVNELRERLTQDNIFYGLIRTTETIDQTVAVKFVLISFIGEAIGVMRKALVSTLRGDITAAFDPFHCELLNVSTKEEVTLEAVTAQLGAMFGGEVHRLTLTLAITLTLTLTRCRGRRATCKRGACASASAWSR